MTNSPNSQKVLPVLHPEIYQSALLDESEQVNQGITDSSDLPQNGQARKNRYLNTALMLDKSTYEFLRRVTWKRLSIHQYHEPLNISDVQKLAQEFEENKEFTKSIELSLYFSPMYNLLREQSPEMFSTSALVRSASQIFEIGLPTRIREVVVALALPDHDEEDFESNVAETSSLMFLIPKFQLLSTFKFLTDDLVHVSESFLASIIKKLEHVEVILLYIPDGSLESRGKEVEQNDLGEALASREKLKSLNIRYLNSPNSKWLNLKWKCQLKELTIELRRDRTTLEPQNLIRFCHLFRHSLVSLYHLSLPLQQTEEEKTLIKDFGLLRHFTFSGNLQSLSLISHFPNLETFTWILEGPMVIDEVIHFMETYSPNENPFQKLELFLESYSIHLECEDINAFNDCVEAVTDLNSTLNPRPANLEI
ncbi:hypothetical protein CROQUDRAFT_720384 [Cronartium quercuum f. sp. fusiforme G11]|uniref:Uncharacterized protein n=1 Tax=Cronartium quercuum f. sp. fusiforme G11 TaxID=708437 RepID=A0A9P6NUY3_9BASI|nr:hypothetical protein CROQUDRAFT_720384 [Cronartium quercuum f. sp. fusiforme G11]